MVTDSGYLPYLHNYIGIFWENLDRLLHPKTNLQNLVYTFSRISTFPYPHTSQPYNKIGSTHISNNLSITSVGRFSLQPVCICEYMAFEVLLCSNFLALTKEEDAGGATITVAVMTRRGKRIIYLHIFIDFRH